MESARLKLISPKASMILAEFDSVTETKRYIADDGPLGKDIRSFLVSVAGMLKRDCKVQDWKQDFPVVDDGYACVRFYPKAWDLPKVGPIALGIYWTNPFLEDAEDLCVYLRIPWNCSQLDRLRDSVLANIPEGFTDVYDGEADEVSPLWCYLRFQDFVVEGRFDVEG